MQVLPMRPVRCIIANQIEKLVLKTLQDVIGRRKTLTIGEVMLFFKVVAFQLDAQVTVTPQEYRQLQLLTGDFIRAWEHICDDDLLQRAPTQRLTSLVPVSQLAATLSVLFSRSTSILSVKKPVSLSLSVAVRQRLQKDIAFALSDPVHRQRAVFKMQMYTHVFSTMSSADLLGGSNSMSPPMFQALFGLVEHHLDRTSVPNQKSWLQKGASAAKWLLTESCFGENGDEDDNSGGDDDNSDSDSDQALPRDDNPDVTNESPVPGNGERRGSLPLEERVMEMFSTIDSDHSFGIEFPEFLSLVGGFDELNTVGGNITMPDVLQAVGDLQRRFSLLDANKDGEVGPVDMQKALSLLGFGRLFEGGRKADSVLQLYEAMQNLIDQISPTWHGNQSSRKVLTFRALMVLYPSYNELYELFQTRHGKLPTLSNVLSILFGSKEHTENWRLLSPEIMIGYSNAKQLWNSTPLLATAVQHARDEGMCVERYNVQLPKLQAACSALDSLAADEGCILPSIANVIEAAEIALAAFKEAAFASVIKAAETALAASCDPGASVAPTADAQAAFEQMKTWVDTLKQALDVRMQTLCRYCLLAMLSDDSAPMLEDAPSKEPDFSVNEMAFGHGGLLYSLLTPIYAPVQQISEVLYQSQKRSLQDGVEIANAELQTTRLRLAQVRKPLAQELCEAAYAIHCIAIVKDGDAHCETRPGPGTGTATVELRIAVNQMNPEQLANALQSASISFDWLGAKRLTQLFTSAGDCIEENGVHSGEEEGGWQPSVQLFCTMKKIHELENKMGQQSNELECKQADLEALSRSRHRPVTMQTRAESICSFVMRLLYWFSAVYALWAYHYTSATIESEGGDQELAVLRGFQPVVLLVLNAMIGAGHAGYHSRIKAGQHGRRRMKNRLQHWPVNCPFDKRYRTASAVLKELELHADHDKGSQSHSFGPLRLILGGKLMCTRKQAVLAILVCFAQAVGPRLISSTSAFGGVAYQPLDHLEHDLLSVVNFLQCTNFLFQCLQACNAIEAISNKARYFSTLTDMDAAMRSSLPYMNILSSLSTLDAWYSIRKYTKTFSSGREQTICQLTIAVLFVADLALAAVLLFLLLSTKTPDEVEAHDSQSFSVLQALLLMDVAIFSGVIFYVIDRGVATNESYNQQAKDLTRVMWEQSFIMRNSTRSEAGDITADVRLGNEARIKEHCSNIKITQEAIERTLHVIRSADQPITIATIELTEQFKKRFTTTAATLVSAAVSVITKGS
jgi:hypothetical protein